MKPDVSVIRAALSNLPKTLDETYERIFLSIPEDDWLSVQHAFHWLIHHNELFQTNIPLSTLLQAVQHSTRGLLSTDADELHDFEGLRERCGCLIIIEQEDVVDENKSCLFQRSTVSFAHYTVKEYLQSPRISQKMVRFFVLRQNKIQRQFIELALRQALTIRRDALLGYDPVKDPTAIHSLLDSNFALYCGVFSVLQFREEPKAITSHSILMELSETFVNPYRPHYIGLQDLLEMAKTTFNISPDDWRYADEQFWGMVWEQDSDPDPAIFLNFLIMSGDVETPILALTFAERHSMRNILARQISVSKPVFLPIMEDYDIYRFAMSVPELVAQCIVSSHHHFNFILDLIFKHGVAHFDLSNILLLHIGRHMHTMCKKSCPLERLLRFGADANGPEGAFVTPLQIAVVCRDIHGVEMLLNSGAEPNAIGKNDWAWAPDSLMDRFNYLHGMSSLHIINHFDCDYQGFPYDFPVESAAEEIKTRLLEFGAVEVGPTGSKPESNGALDRGGREDGTTSSDQPAKSDEFAD